MRFLSVIVSTLIVVASFNLLNTTAEVPIVIPDEKLVVPPVVFPPAVIPAPPVVDWSEAECVDCPDVQCFRNPKYVEAVAMAGCDNGSCRRSVVRAVGKVLRVPVRAVKATGKVLRVPAKAVKKVAKVATAPIRFIRERQPVRRMLSRVFGWRR